MDLAENNQYQWSTGSALPYSWSVQTVRGDDLNSLMVPG